MAEPEKISKKKPAKLIVIALLAIVAVGAGVKLFFFQSVFRYAGTLDATKVDISSQVPSTIGAVDVREGDHVEPSQKLVRLECQDIRIAQELAIQNYTRSMRLFKTGTAPQETLDQMKNRRDDANVRLGWCEIGSSLHATVMNRYHEPGEWVNVGTKLLTLANIRDIWAYIYVAQPDVSRLKPGMKLQGYLPELHDRAFEGTILKINSEAEFTPKNVQTRSERERLVFGVKVSFFGSNDEEVLKPGMTIEVVLPKE